MPIIIGLLIAPLLEDDVVRNACKLGRRARRVPPAAQHHRSLALAAVTLSAIVRHLLTPRRLGDVPGTLE